MTNLILLNMGYFLIFLALASREILWLRITAGELQADLMLILNGKTDIIRDGETIAILERGQLLRKSAILRGN